MGFLNGVKSFSSCVIACTKKLKSKTPGFLKGVSRLPRKIVVACSRESKSKPPEEEPPLFAHVTLKLLKYNSSWVTKLEALMSDLSGFDGVRSCDYDNEKEIIQLSGLIIRSKFMKHIQKFVKSGQLKVENMQMGTCSAQLYKKKAAPSTNNANPPTNNTNTTVGCYQPQVYGYGNWGGYYDYLTYNGNSYNYRPEPAVYPKRIGYDHIDCAGDASQCNFHHNEKAVTPDKTEDKPSENTVSKPAGSRKRN